MKLKKLLGFLLAMTMIVALLSACGSKESKSPKADSMLPYGLKFGMSYEKAQSTCKGFPSISNASVNEGYFSDRFDPNVEDYYIMFGIDEDTLYNDGVLVLDPAYYFSFNTDKELYEFYAVTKIYDGEANAEYLFNAYVQYYSEKTDVEPDIRESDTRLMARFETEEAYVSVMLEVDDTDFLVSFCVHNYEYDLNN